MRKTVSVDNETKDKIDYIAKTVGKSRRALMRELFGNLFDLLTFFSSANLWYDTTILKGQLIITVNGSRRVTIGKSKVKKQ